MSKAPVTKAVASRPDSSGGEGWTPTLAEIRNLIDKHGDWRNEALWACGENADAGCLLGRWLDNVPADSGRWKAYVIAVIEAHALFHEEVRRAGVVMGAGNIAEAVDIIMPGGAAGNASDRLVAALEVWADALLGI